MKRKNVRILVLEDNPNRIRKFKSALIGFVVDYAAEADEAIQLLSEKKYDLIFLDHDLGGEEWVSSTNPNTGYQVAKVVAEKTGPSSTFVIIHSMNHIGADNINGVLPHAMKIPFRSLNIKRQATEVNEAVRETEMFAKLVKKARNQWEKENPY